MNEPSDLVEAFKLLWGKHAAPDLDVFLSQAGVVDTTQLSELARIDQAARWQRGDRRLAEEYLDRYPRLQADHENAIDLIYHEYLLREKLAEPLSLEALVSRFPNYATALSKQIELHGALLCGTVEVSNGPAEIGTPSPESSWRYDHLLNGLHAPGSYSAAAVNPRSVGRYELLEVAGSGSFGTVYRARDPELDRIVAIKIPRYGNFASDDDIQRFWREARSVARLRHPSIVSVHEIGWSGRTPFLVSDFVQGTTLDTVMSSTPLRPTEAAALVATVADALHYAHEMGVIHRDVKAANIMLDELSRPRLMDFGLARRDVGDATITMDGQVVGTPAYMSPEQARGESRKVDGRSDVYSLGVVFYQLLTGELPFRGSTQSLLHQVLNDEPRRPRSLHREIPSDLETICLRAMAKEPAARYLTARDLADDLRRFLRNEPIRSRPVGRVELFWRWCRRKPAVASLSAIVAILLVAIAVGGTAVVSLLLAAIAAGGSLVAAKFRRQVQTEKQLRNEADETLYYHRIALAYRDLTANRPHPGRAEKLLDACPPQRRNWEWNYLKQLWRTDPVVLRVPGTGKFRGIAFSCDGRHLAAACGDGRIRIWDQHTGKMTVLPGHDAFVYSVAFSPVDPNRLVTSGNDGCIRVWDVESQRETLPQPLPGLQVYAVGMARCVTFSPDGRRVAAVSEAATVQIWDVVTGQRTQRLEGHSLQASCVAFSRNGQLLATGDWGGAVRIWDMSTGRLLTRLQLSEHRWPVACIAFSPGSDERLLAAGYFDSHVDVWDTASGELHRQLRGHTGFVSSVEFHPRDARRLASAGEDRAVRIWDVPTEREILQLPGHLDSCSGLAFRPDGRRLATASYDQTIRLWDAGVLAANPSHLRHTLDIESEVWCVAISPDGTRLSAAGENAGVRIWDTATGCQLHALSNDLPFPMVIFSLVFSPDGRRLATAGFDDGAPPTVLKVWDIATGQLVLEHRETQEIFATEFSPDGSWLAFGLADGSVKLVDTATGKRVALVGKHDDPIAYGCVRFRHDGLRLTSGSLDGTARIWDLTTVLSAAGDKSPPDGRGHSPGWCVRMSTGDPGIALWSVSYSPDGRYLITGDKGGRLKRWNAETGEELETKCESSGGAYLSVAYTPNGRWIVSASEDCTIRAYDARTLEFVQSFRGHLGPIRCLAAANELIATGSTDKTVKVWSLRGLRPRAPH